MYSSGWSWLYEKWLSVQKKVVSFMESTKVKSALMTSKETCDVSLLQV